MIYYRFFKTKKSDTIFFLITNLRFLEIDLILQKNMFIVHVILSCHEQMVKWSVKLQFQKKINVRITLNLIYFTMS